MLKVHYLLLSPLLSVLLACSNSTIPNDNRVFKLQLNNGDTVIVQEGEFEARSIGSFTVRLYRAAEPANATTFFVSGLLQARDGFIERVLLEDIDADEQADIVVLLRSVGSGNYITAHAFSAAQRRLRLIASTETLAADADPVAVLRSL